MPPTPKPTAERPRRARGSLSQEEILDGAYELVSDGGLDALSMPILARHLGAGVTSIYWYFRNKDELLVALAERVTEDVYAALPRIGTGPWKDELRSYFTQHRDVLHRFPLYGELFSMRPRFVVTRPRILPLVLGRLDEQVKLLTDAGLSASNAARAFYACEVYSRSYVMLEQGVVAEPGELEADVHDRLLDTVSRLDRDEYPVISALGDLEPVTAIGADQHRRGLELLLDGIEAQLTRANPRTGRRRSRSLRST